MATKDEIQVKIDEVEGWLEQRRAARFGRGSLRRFARSGRYLTRAQRQKRREEYLANIDFVLEKLNPSND